jgi:predicted phosphodiesterase
MKYLKHELSRDFKSLEVYPLNDLHIGDGLTDVKLFLQFKKFILAEPHRYLILNGDLMNNAIKSSVSNCYAETMNPHEQKKWLICELKELKSRILGITSGNHENRNKKEVDNDITYDIAAALDLEHLYDENGIVMKISVGENHNKQRQVTYVFYVSHGSGGGKYVGSSVNNLENYGLAFENVDIFVMGHVHKKAASRQSKIHVDVHNNTIYQRDVLHVISAPWQDYGGYAQRKMMRPGTKGATPIILSGKSKRFEVLI